MVWLWSVSISISGARPSMRAHWQFVRKDSGSINCHTSKKTYKAITILWDIPTMITGPWFMDVTSTEFSGRVSTQPSSAERRCLTVSTLVRLKWCWMLSATSTISTGLTLERAVGLKQHQLTKSSWLVFLSVSLTGWTTKGSTRIPSTQRNFTSGQTASCLLEISWIHLSTMEEVLRLLFESKF